METQNNIDRLLDVEMNVTVRFGRTELPLRDVVGFGVGSMLELNRTVDEPVELLVNNYPFARGEVVVVDGYYGVRVTEIGSPDERSKTLFPIPVTLGETPAEETFTDFAPVEDAPEIAEAAIEAESAESAESAAQAVEESAETESTEEQMEDES